MIDCALYIVASSVLPEFCFLSPPWSAGLHVFCFFRRSGGCLSFRASRDLGLQGSLCQLKNFRPDLPEYLKDRVTVSGTRQFKAAYVPHADDVVAITKRYVSDTERMEQFIVVLPYFDCLFC